VRSALRNFRNKTGFHQCPRCKGRSVWRCDPTGTLEETLHVLLKVSPYRCARCDQRFMDSKVCPADASAQQESRWRVYVGSVTSRMLGSSRTPLEEVLKLRSILVASVEKHSAPLPDSVEQLTKV
jgi:dissimilatory sulfite reductase (desulfoviridin) alpha/beta subunit